MGDVGLAMTTMRRDKHKDVRTGAHSRRFHELYFDAENVDPGILGQDLKSGCAMGFVCICF